MRTAVGALVVALVTAISPLAPAAHAAGTSSPCAAFDATTRTDPVLGKGLTITTPFAANLVPAGRAARVDLNVATRVSATLTYTVRTWNRVLLSKTIAVPSVTTALALPPAQPGAYQLEARLLQGGTQVGGTCLRYGVAMAGAALNPAALPPGADWGGGSALRDTAVHAQLGSAVVRRQLDFGQAVANPLSLVGAFTDAAALAKRHGLLFDMQVGQGGAAERKAIGSPAWEAGVRAIVASQRGVVPYWEAWNEPNYDAFFRGTATDYVSRVLRPFSRAVHAADPAAKVVGGSTAGVDLRWWKEFAAAGGFSYLDVVSVHPYEWDTAWERTSVVSDLKAVIALKGAHGAAAKPLWDTESGYRSLAEAGGAYAQADNIIHKLLWERTLQVPTQSYQLEGGWEDWSVIDYFRGVKPAAMAMSALKTVIQGRGFSGFQRTGRAQVYAATFTPRGGSSERIVAVWTDGRAVTLPLRARHRGYDEYGTPFTTGSSLQVTGSVRYLRYASGTPAL